METEFYCFLWLFFRKSSVFFCVLLWLFTMRNRLFHSGLLGEPSRCRREMPSQARKHFNGSDGLDSIPSARALLWLPCGAIHEILADPFAVWWNWRDSPYSRRRRRQPQHHLVSGPTAELYPRLGRRRRSIVSTGCTLLHPCNSATRCGPFIEMSGRRASCDDRRPVASSGRGPPSVIGRRLWGARGHPRSTAASTHYVPPRDGHPTAPRHRSRPTMEHPTSIHGQWRACRKKHHLRGLL
jgi:hypothetical protein